MVRSAGYTVKSAGTDDEAMRLLEDERFDLILLGRKSVLPKVGIDQRLRERYPELLTLKIDPDLDVSPWPSRVTNAVPSQVLEVLREMLGE
jgi:hypothetical protein